MILSRRNFTLASMLGAGIASVAPKAGAQSETLKSRIKLGISSYSYWHFTEKKYPVEKVIDHAAELGVEGVDVLQEQLESEDNAYLQKMKRHAFLNGIDLICLSVQQNFVSPKKEELDKQINNTKKFIEQAYKMGIPAIRLNSGRWKTIKSFDDLMAKRGVEPAIPGYTEDDAFKWCIDSIHECIPKAEECGVMLLLENHWGLSSTPEGLLRIRKAVDSPFMGIMLDTGNFLEEPYDKLRTVAPYANMVQAKTYYGGGEWYTLDLDYKKIAQILADVKYQGYMSLEYEGKAPADEGVRKSIELFRKCFS